MDLLEKIAFHTKAIGKSIAESAVDTAVGFADLYSKEAPRKANDLYVDVKNDIGAPLAVVMWPFAYLANVTVYPIGEALGNGAGMIANHKSGEEVALGVTSVVAGGCAVVGMVGSVFMPKPTINIPIPKFSFSPGGVMLSSDGALIAAMPEIAVSVSSVPVAVPAQTAAGVVASGSIGNGASYMSGDGSGKAVTGSVPEPKGGGGSPRPPNRYRSWKELYLDAKEFAGKAYRAIKEDNRVHRAKDWLHDRYAKKDIVESPKFERPADVGRIRWTAQRIGTGFKDFFSGHFRTIQKNIKGTVKCIDRFFHHPLTETLDILNRPGRFFMLASDIYGLARLFTAVFRRVTDSKKTNPLGSEIIPEKLERVGEPALGIFGSAALGGMIEHYLFGWGRGAAFVFEGVFAAGSAMLQSSSGGAAKENIDWNRLDLSTAITAIVWGPVSVYNKVARTAFPSTKWAVAIERLSQNGHTGAAMALKAVPSFLAPEVIPSLSSVLTYWGLMTAHTYAVLPIDVWSDDENPKEYAKSISTKLSTYLLATRWFDLAFSTYTRPVISLISATTEIFLSAKFSEYFQIYKGKRFYREPLHDLVRFDASADEAMEQLASALCSKNLVGDRWKFEDQDWYDFAQDIYAGEFSPEEVEYFRELAEERALAQPGYERVQSLLRYILRSNGIKKDEFFQRIDDINSGLDK